MIPFESIARRGNGFAIGEVTGPGVTRWHIFLHVQFRRPR